MFGALTIFLSYYLGNFAVTQIEKGDRETTNTTLHNLLESTPILVKGYLLNEGSYIQVDFKSDSWEHFVYVKIRAKTHDWEKSEAGNESSFGSMAPYDDIYMVFVSGELGSSVTLTIIREPVYYWEQKPFQIFGLLGILTGIGAVLGGLFYAIKK